MTEAADIEIRTLQTTADLHACVELQRDIWGRDQPEIVPATLLHVVGYVGGLVAGAFSQSGELEGFVFGVTGVRDGVLSHWSHQLGVRHAARDRGIGRMLKEHQRRSLTALGVMRIYWSFDPLMAKNAYLNLNRLGASVVEYVPDMYGTTESPLHLGMPTDRLIVRLDPDSRPLSGGPGGAAPVLTAFPRAGDDVVPLADRMPARFLVEVPADMLEVVRRSPSEAKQWRMSVREYLQWALSHGYQVRGIERTQNRAFFWVSRENG